MDWKEVTIGLLIIAVVASTVYWQGEMQRYQQDILTLQQQFLQKNSVLQKTIEQRHEQQPPAPTQKIIEKEQSPPIKTRTMPVVGYDRITQKGVVGYVEVSLLPGNGDVLIDIKPFNAPAVQNSVQNAVTAALKEANMRLGYRDIKVKFSIAAPAVGGDSAGIAIALATLALLTNKDIKDDVAATGTINPDGSVGKIGGILPKAEALSKKGTRLFLIPRGEGEITTITPQYFVDPDTGKIIGKGDNVRRKIDVIQEARSRWNIELQQVATLNDAKRYVLE